VTSNFQKVQDFQDKMEMATGVWPFGSNHRGLWAGLVEEEFNELMDEVYDPEPDKKRVAKEIADLLYVAYGMASAFGIPIDTVFKEVHRSNMSKLGPDGKPVKRADGKVTKGPNYKPADLSFLDE
jgi:predicted HAD superfamily Cof-like phosphohydrolase